MQIQPPKPEQPETPQLRQKMGYMTTLVIWFLIILVITLVAWIMLWGGGIKQAVQANDEAHAEQRAASR
jgi:hypothetical protein